MTSNKDSPEVGFDLPQSCPAARDCLPVVTLTEGEMRVWVGSQVVHSEPWPSSVYQREVANLQRLRQNAAAQAPLPLLCSSAISKLVADMEAEAIKQESYWPKNWEWPCYQSGHSEGYAQATRKWMAAIKATAKISHKEGA